MNIFLPILRKLLFVVLWLAAGAAQATDLVIIVSAKSTLASLRAQQVADIFLAQTAQFPDGDDAVALDLPVGTSLRDEFYSKVAERSPALMKAYWTKMIFTGRGQPPRELSNSFAVRKMVAENPGAIGYIDRSALDSSVKALMVTR